MKRLFPLFFILVNAAIVYSFILILHAHNIYGAYVAYLVFTFVLITLEALLLFSLPKIKNHTLFSLFIFMMRIYLGVMRMFWPRAKYHMYQGKLYALQKRYDLGFQELNRAIEMAPHMAQIYLFRGATYREIHEYEQALLDLEQALHCDQSYWQAYLNKGIVYRSLKEYARALENFNQALHLATHKRHKLLIYHWQGVIYQQMGEHQRALDEFQSILALFPRDAKTYNLLAMSHIMLKQYEQAIQVCKRAIAITPRNGCVYDNRGRAYLGLNNLERARADFTKGSKLDPTHITHTWHVEWTRFCLEMPDEEAARRLDAMAEIDTHLKLTWVCKGVACWIRGAAEEALREFDRSIQFEPIQWDAYFWKGIAFASLQRDEEARASIEAALANSMPPILLLPLRWLKQERPEFYQHYASSYGLETAFLLPEIR